MVDVFETSRERPGERHEFWVDTIRTQCMPVQIDLRHDRLPDARMSCGGLGVLHIRDVLGGDHVYTRDHADIRQADPGMVQVGMPLGGRSLMIQDGREATLSGGDMVLYDSSRPFTIVMEGTFHWQIFLLPKAKLRRSDRELSEVTAITLPGASGMSRPVSAFLRGLAAEAPLLEDAPGADALGENASDLIATMVRSRFGQRWDVTDPDGVLRESVGTYLRDHHGDPGLCPERVAAAHGVSVRRLHALFEPTGVSVSARLRAERLAAIRADLADPALAHRPVERIAAAHGLRNPSAFGRLFRATEGITPREFRTAALRPR